LDELEDSDEVEEELGDGAASDGVVDVPTGNDEVDDAVVDGADRIDEGREENDEDEPNARAPCIEEVAEVEDVEEVEEVVMVR
jgi:hypothetical protein